jgi:hypothetical protein
VGRELNCGMLPQKGATLRDERGPPRRFSSPLGVALGVGNADNQSTLAHSVTATLTHSVTASPRAVHEDEESGAPTI